MRARRRRGRRAGARQVLGRRGLGERRRRARPCRPAGRQRERVGLRRRGRSSRRAWRPSASARPCRRAPRAAARATSRSICTTCTTISASGPRVARGAGVERDAGGSPRAVDRAGAGQVLDRGELGGPALRHSPEAPSVGVAGRPTRHAPREAQSRRRARRSAGRWRRRCAGAAAGPPLASPPASGRPRSAAVDGHLLLLIGVPRVAQRAPRLAPGSSSVDGGLRRGGRGRWRGRGAAEARPRRVAADGRRRRAGSAGAATEGGVVRASVASGRGESFEHAAEAIRRTRARRFTAAPRSARGRTAARAAPCTPAPPPSSRRR